MQRINVQESTSGQNFFGIEFASDTPLGTSPDWGTAARYYFYDGRAHFDAVGPHPGRLRMLTGAGMDAMITFEANSTVDSWLIGIGGHGGNYPINRVFKIFANSSGSGYDATTERVLSAIHATTGNAAHGGVSTNQTGQRVMTFYTGVTPTTFNNPGLVALARSGVTELFAFDTAGNFTQLSAHDPDTGEPYHNSFNVYTGEGVQVYELDRRVIRYTVDRIDPEAVAHSQGLDFSWHMLPPFVRKAWGKNDD
jgi:hypothetical protein